MFTSLDLLIIVTMGLAAGTLLSLCLMFLLKNKTAKRVCFYIVEAFALYMASVGLRIGIAGMFPSQILMAVFFALMGIVAFVLERVSKENKKMLLISRILAAVSLVGGFVNALLL